MPVRSIGDQRLERAYEPERICLVGSVAREDSDAGSDYDLMIFVPARRTEEGVLSEP